jgi:AcrR family transcriptional regulator
MSAAQRLFLEQGVAVTTIEQITKRADVAKGTFYLYFSSKEDVLAGLADRFSQDLLARIQAGVGEVEATNWRGKLTVWATACISGYLDAIRLHDILFYGSRPATREGMVDNIVIDDLTTLLQGGCDEGAWAIDDPRFLAVFLFSGLHAVVDNAYSKEKRLNQRRLVRMAEQVCLNTVDGSSSRPSGRI